MKSNTAPGHKNRKSSTAPSGGNTSLVTRSAERAQKSWKPRQSAQQEALKPLEEKPLEEIVLSLTERVALLRQQALEMAQYQQHFEAIALFTELLTLKPDSARDYNNRGLVYFQSGQHEEALADYNRALELDSSLDSAHNNRANYYAAVGMFLEAILDYDAALDLNPTNVRAWINQGITFRELRMYERAIECFDCALSLRRLSGHVYAERGRTYHLWGDWNCAIADYRNAELELTDPNTNSPTATVRLLAQITNWLEELFTPIVS